MSDDEFWFEVLRLARTINEQTYYQLLDIGHGADGEAVREAFVARSGIYHPDRHAVEADPERRRALVSLQARLNEAYRVLSNPRRRGDYDKAIAAGTSRLVGRASTRPIASDPSSQQARRYYEQGQQCERSRDPAGAAMYFGFALQVEPGSTAIRAALARLGVSPPGDRTAPSTPPAPEPRSEPRRDPTEPTLPMALPRAPTISLKPEPEAAVATASDLPPAVTISFKTHREPAAAAAPALAPATSLPRAPTVSFKSEARKDQRLPFSQVIQLRCSSWKHFIQLHTRDLSRGGLFIKTGSPLAVATRVQLSLDLPDGSSLTLDAEVTHIVNVDSARPDAVAGMGVRFDVDAQKRKTIDALVHHAICAIAQRG